MLSTVMNNVVSLTVQCARCHDHKFDAISQEEYYQLQAVFAGVERANRTVDVSAEVGDGGARVSGAKTRVGERFRGRRGARSQRRVASGSRRLGAKPSSEQRVRWTTLEATNAASANGATLTRQPDGSLALGRRSTRDRRLHDRRSQSAAARDCLAG